MPAPWNIAANNPPKITPPINPGNAGTFITTITITRTGANNRIGLIVNCAVNPLKISFIEVISIELAEYLIPMIP